MVRNADALTEAGYDVVVISTDFPTKNPPDYANLTERRWRTLLVDMRERPRSRVHWQLVRARRKLSLEFAQRWPLESVVRRACCYAGPEMAELAARQRAVLYLAHTHSALPAAAEAARRVGAKLAFDVEDLLAESPSEPVRLMRAIERSFIPRCAFICTMSRSAAHRLQELLGLQETPMVLHNTPSLREREGLLPPDQRPISDVVSIYWFGQTIGPHSCAEQVLRSIPFLIKPAKLVLRGNPIPSYIARLESLAVDLGLRNCLEVNPRASPTEMVRLAGKHDVLIGSQATGEPFHQMAIGNKVFTGLMAGALLALTDTVAHRALAIHLGQSALLFPNNDSIGLARQLNATVGMRERLLSAKSLAWQLAESRFNWENESQALLRRVHALIGPPTPSKTSHGQNALAHRPAL
jgi:glycosyltransferase involved in cell wall biosynthesis